MKHSVAVNTYKDDEIKDIASKINQISLNFQLAHACFAYNVYVEETLKKQYENELNNINTKFKKLVSQDKRQLKDADYSKQEKDLNIQKDMVMEKLKFLNSHVFIMYLKNSTHDYGRTVYDGENLIIYLSPKLLNESIVEGEYTERIKDLREITAHELGHAVLHGKEIKQSTDTAGTINVSKNDDQEHEASVFANELIKLRHERNQKTKDNGVLDKYF